MTQYLVAGAGHGGLTTALHLARAGEKVTVVERLPRGEMGYDFCDAMEMRNLQRNGFRPLPDGAHKTAYCAAMYGPAKRWPTTPKQLFWTKEWHAERKAVLAVMVEDCMEAGVEFLFETEIIGPLCDGCRVVGLRVKDAQGEREMPADLVIDAAGWQSPVRRNLPADCPVPKELKQIQIFHAWRGFFNRKPGPDPEHFFNNYLSHMGRKGLSWVQIDPVYADVMMGTVGAPMTEEELASGLADLRESNPLLGDTLLRGGKMNTIPLRRFLGLFVADGYAGVGDSACMADPFGGSGVGSAMDAGKVLAKYLLEHCKGDFSVEKLWAYQYHIFTEPTAAEAGYPTADAKKRATTDVLKSTILVLKPQQIDVMFKRGIIAMGGVNGPKEAISLLLHDLDHLPLIFKLAGVAGRGKKLTALVEAIPKDYDKEAVTAWSTAYEEFKMV